ncbi:uncharacterized protein PV09_06272 [Verruconis gallopava]|uniref:Defect at low temperature protein 1 n=1 Tax=Verruconis gallopava TaxID=253628 RepID=A0A0D2ATJ6_9PEZI|nr:uncharacterized protein PV09_06272 [Verruconis gallopava]KIW02464.1 hypothetical protein PV09_06272 [Verruconis gallopava]
MAAIKIPFFQIWYSSAFLIIVFLTWVATLVSPTDLVYSCIRIKNVPNGIAVGAIYIGTLLVALFIWSSRIYTNRATLKEIPRCYIPVDKGEVPRKVHKMIKKQWERSAIVAWDSRPRDIREELTRMAHEDDETRHGFAGLLKGHAKKRTEIPPDVALAAWGHISHPGWSSPSDAKLPSLEYYRVFVELPNLIEAKAVSLAPPDPAFYQNGLVESGITPIPDARVVALLQRPATQGLREYLARLADFNLVNPPDAAEDFLAQYEAARFSTRPLTEYQFQNLMTAFSALLTGMTDLDVAAVEMELASSSSASSLRTFTTSSESLPPVPSNRLSAPSSHVGTVQTALSRARTPSRLHHAPSGSSLGSVIRSNYGGGSALRISSSNPSLRSNGSVIRLNPSPRPGDEPYEYVYDEG